MHNSDISNCAIQNFIDVLLPKVIKLFFSRILRRIKYNFSVRYVKSVRSCILDALQFKIS